ncbi:MAG: porphobilinogen synthase, partial [Pseudomonadota bacterium]
MSYPIVRLRRLRNSNFIRSLVAEHKLDVNDLIWPCFVVDGERQIQSITTMPGVERYSIDTLLKKLEHVVALGIKAIALFPSIDSKLKDKVGSQALNENNLICRCIKAIKQQWPDLGVIADVALDPYTNHGHDGIYEHGHVANDKTVEVLKQQAIILAASGADVVAPSDM